MRHEKNLNCITGAALAFILSLGAAGAMITGLRLNIPHMMPVVIACALSACISALCFRFRQGGLVLLGVLVPVSWWLFRGEETVQQILYMLHSILRRFHNAYGWEVPRFVTVYTNPASMLRPAAMVGGLVAITVSAAVCRRKPPAAAVFAAAVPFFLCFVVTDTVPDTKYLFMWMLGMFLLILTGSVRQRDGIQGARLAAMAALPAALALALLFWLVPRDTYDRQPEQLQRQISNWVQELPDLWEQISEDVAGRFSGVAQPSQLNLQNLGPRPKLNYPVMEVTAPKSGTVYLRGQDYDVYDGTGWTATLHRREDFSREELGTGCGTMTIVTRRVRSVMYLPYYPGDTVILVGGTLDNKGDLREYSFPQLILPRDWRHQVEEASRNVDQGIHFTTNQNDTDRRRYITLPADTLEWARELTDSILTDARSATEKADAIARYVRGSAVYDTDTQRMPRDTEDFARWFLEESDRGYCVHFATAATVLLRSAGVEARYVEGYMFRAVADTAVTVTEESSHAWVEYYEPVLDAWIVLEATPADEHDHPGQAVPETAPQRQTEPSLPQATEAPGELPESTAPEAAPERPWPADKPSARHRWLMWVFSAAAAGALVLLQRNFRLALRRRKEERGSINDRGLLLWQRSELMYRLLKEPVPEELWLLAQKAGYSRHGISPEELERMRAYVRDAQHRLGNNPWYIRILHRYFYVIY